MIWVEDFLSVEQRDRLLTYADRNQDKFQPATTRTGAANWRSAMVLHEFGFKRTMRGHVLGMMPSVCTALGIPEFEPSLFECQFTASNDGDFYKLHNDNGHPEVCQRRITFAYYFWAEPKAFEGGELVLGGEKLELHNNACLFFDSGTNHEVLPVSCPSKEFGHSRFTLNGWISA